MTQVEKIEDWAGQEVVGSDDEKIGKLEDVYFASGSAEPALASVKSGFLGRKLHLVPLERAAVTRDHVKVAFTKEQVSDAPELAAEGRLGETEREAVASHFGITLEGEGWESASARNRREAEAAGMEERVAELDEAARVKRERAREGEQQATASSREAQDLEAQRAEAEQKARELRESGDGPIGS